LDPIPVNNFFRFYTINFWGSACPVFKGSFLSFFPLIRKYTNIKDISAIFSFKQRGEVESDKRVPFSKNKYGVFVLVIETTERKILQPFQF